MSKRLTADQAIAVAAREATAAATGRAVEIAELCVKMEQPGQMTELILGGKTVAECETELKAKIATQSWDSAIKSTGTAL